MTDITNQTQFTFEKPIFESPPTVPSSDKNPPKPWYRRPLVLGILGLVAFIFLVLVLAMMAQPDAPLVDEQIELESTPVPAALGPLEQRLNELKTELQAADPTKQELPFPPVNMELELATPK